VCGGEGLLYCFSQEKTNKNLVPVVRLYWYQGAPGTKTEESPAHSFCFEIESIHHLKVSILGKYFCIFFIVNNVGNTTASEPPTVSVCMTKVAMTVASEPLEGSSAESAPKVVHVCLAMNINKWMISSING